MLMGALAAFTLVALLGLLLLAKVWRGCFVDPGLLLLHAGIALLGAAMVVVVALQGDARLYTNIGMALIIIPQGLWMSFRRRKTGIVSKGMLLLHTALAVACYALLAYFTLVPGATLPI